MTWPIEESEIRELFALPAADRAVNFFQLVVDWEEAWGLQDENGWVVGEGNDALPLWPHSAFAEACARGPWEGAVPGSISLDDLLVDLLPLLAADNLRAAVFPTPDSPGLLMTPAELGERLEEELRTGA
ncbi:MAG: DUF2750 domain-containing protein [Thermoanaerobaculia bacterium]